MKGNRITIKDIARELGISKSTVSRALQDNPNINGETKKKVIALAQKLNYQPNSIALSLRSQRSNMIGIVIPNFVYYFFASAISGIEDIALQNGYNVIVCQSNDSMTREENVINSLLSNRVDGLLVSLSRETNSYQHLERILDLGMPLVMFDRDAEESFPVSRVIIDDIKAAYQATEHLIKTGCKKIAHIGGPNEPSISRKRLNGFLTALRDYDIPVREEWLLQSNFSPKSGRACMNRILDMPERPDGIVAITDPVAISAIQVMKARDIKIPDEISIIGFADEPPAQIIDPGLSSVMQDPYRIGQEAARLFFEELKAGATEGDKEFTPITKVMDTKLVIRKSTRPLKVV